MFLHIPSQIHHYTDTIEKLLLIEGEVFFFDGLHIFNNTVEHHVKEINKCTSYEIFLISLLSQCQT
jgi:hypothetical protein